jgi:feruloyl esterase
MVPGMHHCLGGPGPNAFGASFQLPVPSDPEHDIVKALERWVERGIAPASIIATKYIDDEPAKGVLRTRPICPYPRVAKYLGKGSTNVAASFECREP